LAAPQKGRAGFARVSGSTTFSDKSVPKRNERVA